MEVYVRENLYTSILLSSRSCDYSVTEFIGGIWLSLINDLVKL